MSKIFNIDRIVSSITDYVKVKIDLVKVDLIQRLSGVAALLISFTIILVLLFFVLGFASITVANILNQALESLYLGYLIVTGFYFLLLVVVILLLKTGRIQAAIENAVAKSLELEEDDE